MKTVVVTGANRGIGKATAEKFLSKGWRVVATSMSGKGWEAENISWVQLDLAKPESVERAVGVVKKSSFDVLVDNAGAYPDEEYLADTPIKRKNLRAVLEVNLIGTVDFTEQLLNHISSTGHIILLGSRAGSLTTEKVSTSEPSYRISKAALSMYTRLLAERLRNTEITVSIVDPGWVRTDMGGDDAERDVSEPAEEIFVLATSSVPSGKFWREGKERNW